MVIHEIARSVAVVVGATAEAREQTKRTPAQIRPSITPEAIISVEDGKSCRTLRPHLATRGLAPGEYRGKWGLPRDDPMVAPDYSEVRSKLAKARGFGGPAGEHARAEAARR